MRNLLRNVRNRIGRGVASVRNRVSRALGRSSGS